MTARRDRVEAADDWPMDEHLLYARRHEHGEYHRRARDRPVAEETADG